MKADERLSGGGLIRLFVRHANAANILMIVLMIFGAWGLTKIRYDVFPAIEYNTLTVNISWPGASAEDNEANILNVVEPALRYLDGVSDMDSRASEGSARITLEFTPDTDMQKAQSDVEAALDGLDTLPQDAEEPQVNYRKRFDLVARVAISGPFSESALRVYAREMRDRLLDAGVDRVTLSGYRAEQIEVNVSHRSLRELGLTVRDIVERISGNTVDVPSGQLEGDVAKQIRVLAANRTVQDIAAIKIVALPSGEVITLDKIATIRRSYDRDQQQSFHRGDRAIELAVYRSPSIDALEASQRLNTFLAEYRQTLPQALKLQSYADRTKFLRARILLLLQNGMTGLALVLIILFVFLNFRIAFWVAMGIPIAFLATFGIMFAMDQSINMISLFALIMTLGIIVDDAIVVGEHTATRLEAGDPPHLAAETGARRMMLPVMAAMLTTVAAFSTILLAGGDMGQFMNPLPMVTIAVLIASLLECFFILPGHLRHAGKSALNAGRFRRGFDDRFDRFRNGTFRRLVALSYTWRYTSCAMALAAAMVVGGLFAGKYIGFVFFPSIEAENISARIVFNAGIDEARAIAALKNIETALYETEKKLSPNERLVETALVTFTRGGRLGDSGRIEVELTDAETRTIRTSAIIRQWQRSMPKQAGIKRIAMRERRPGPRGRDIDIRLLGATPQVLKRASLELQDILRSYPGVSAVDDTLDFGKPELVMQLTPRGAALGFTISSLGARVRDAFQGVTARRLTTEDDEISVKVSQDIGAQTGDSLRNLLIKTPRGDFVALSQIVTFTERQGFAVIRHEDGDAVVGVTADVDTTVTTGADVLERLQAQALTAIGSKYGIRYKLAGRAQETGETVRDLMISAGISLALIYLVIATATASYGRPFAIMFIIPFSIVGAILGHAVLGFNVNIMSLFAVLGLSGIVVNDSIILISRLDERLENGDSLQEAAVGASCDRLRAVLLTSLTTIGGLTPLLFEKSLQAQFLIPMAVTIVFGLATATLLVLFLVPASVGVGDDIVRGVRFLFGLRKGRVRATPAE